MRWEPFSKERMAAEWDRLLDQSSDDNPFQSYAWGEYKRAEGWQPQRWLATGPGGQPVCSMQLLRKPLPLGRSILWAPGGPMTGYPAAGATERNGLFSDGLLRICRLNRAAYARFYGLQPVSSEMVQGIPSFFSAAPQRLGSGSTVQLDLSLSLEELLAGMTRKHRYMVRQVEGQPLEWKSGSTGPLIADLARIHGEMSSTKKVQASEQAEFQRLAGAFGENALVLIGYLQGEPVTGCLVLIKGRSGFYWRAATGAKGRDISAAYGMILQLFQLLKSKGVTRFDFGGVLPGVPSAAGINHFKQGFGGTAVEYLGEWEWAGSPWVRWGINGWIRRRTA